MSDSTALGTLSPLSSNNPENDDSLDAIIQRWTKELTGLPGDMVRPRYQPAPPPSPDQAADWVAFNCMVQVADQAVYQFQATDTEYEQQRHETCEYLFTFYGPDASGNAMRLVAGAFIGQNRDLLFDHGLAVLFLGEADNTPVLTNQIFRGHCDLAVHFRREIKTRFSIRSLLSQTPPVFHNDPT